MAHPTTTPTPDLRLLCTLPAATLTAGEEHLASLRERLAQACPGTVWLGGDPPGGQLGSGGGTANALLHAWQASGARQRFDEWLGSGQCLVLHAGGESRRLPAYGPTGKLLLPLPLMPGRFEARLDQTLADYALPAYRRALLEAGPRAAAMLASGDVLLHFDPFSLPAMQADACVIGMRVPPEVAQDFGVAFIRRQAREGGQGERPLAFFLQKPSPATIRSYAADYDFVVDSGLWLLSAAAVQWLLRASGVAPESLAAGQPLPALAPCDFYAGLAPLLGDEAATHAPHVSTPPGLRASVVVPPHAEFHHLGSSRQLLETLAARPAGAWGGQPHWVVASPGWRITADPRLPVWLENCAGQGVLTAGGHNLLTGLPAGASLHTLPPGIAVDAVPLGAEEWVLRVYHLDDALRGPASAATSKISGQSAPVWLTARGGEASWAQLDLMELPLYPVLAPSAMTQDWLAGWLASTPDPAWARAWHAARRCTARELLKLAAVPRLQAQRLAGWRQSALTHLTQDTPAADTLGRDHAALARLLAPVPPALPAAWLAESPESGAREPVLHARRAALAGAVQPPAARPAARATAFRRLRQAVIGRPADLAVTPRLGLKTDQVVWARGPVRLDLAGGWTDTPPYCFEFGGGVLNVAVHLNGQPPIQVIGRVCPERHLRLSSIDQGLSCEIQDYADLGAYNDPASPFSLPKAALALAGFHPDFLAGPGYPSLAAQLAAFGAGLELSLLCAVPKGSGLGTSSILAATLLGALNRCCHLGWDELALFHRVLAMEQLLTTGGGWQDQAGALFRGLKLTTTEPGLAQHPTVRYLPEHLLARGAASGQYLLYYTGVTRMAKGILQEIVANILLGERRTLGILGDIRANAQHGYQALLQSDEAGLARTVARSWRLNRELDAGTCTPAIQAILDLAGPDLLAAKLLGAGGGGYLLMLAQDPEAGRRLRARLEAQPPNPQARFVDFTIADAGLTVTVS